MSGEKRTYFKIPPEMADGEHWSIISAHDCDLLGESVRDWVRNDPLVGEAITIEVIEMTDAEVEALPDL